MGGISTSIRKDENQFCLKVDEGENHDEFLITRHCQFLKPINIFNVYGEQESRNKNYEIEERWSRICDQLKIIEDRNEEVILIGDMNKLIGNGPFGVKNNNPKVTFGGKLVHQLLMDGKYLLVNNSDKCVGGPFTRVDPANGKSKSCLSLVIISAGLDEYVEELKIDDKRQYTPHRAVKKDGKLVFTDHYGLLFKLKNIPMKVKSLKITKDTVVWNTNKEGGWEKYHDLTSDSRELESIAGNANDMNSDELMLKLSRRMEKIKFQSFGKVKKRMKTIANDRDLEKLYEKRGHKDADEDKINKEINNKLLEYQLRDYERKLICLKNLKEEKGKSAAVFKLKEKIVGSKKVCQEAVTMKDPLSGELIVENDKLKEASVKYVSSLLKNRSPKEEYKDEFNLMEHLHDIRSCNDYDSMNMITDEDYAQFLKQVAKKNKKSYQFILKAGNSFHSVLFALYQKVWSIEKKPAMWENTTCIQLYKGRGRKDDFNNQRFIHTKDEIPKGFEYILINKVKPTMIQSCTKYQIGAIPGHQAAEHLFTIKSIMALFNEAGQPLILQCFDLKKYFDSENLKDAMNSLFECGIRGKEYNLIYELNRQNKIQIKTSVGMSDTFTTGPIVSQGSIGGGLISALNLDYSINKFFLKSNNEIFYHDVRLQPLIYQDDLGKFSSNRMDAQAGNDRIETCMETKLLDLHKDKSCYILIGNKKITEEISTELEHYPLTLYGEKMKQKTSEKYLGDFIHCGGVAKSAEETVIQRVGKMFSASNEIKSFVEDCRCTTLGGLKVGLDIWETAYVPSILNNCSTWMEIQQPIIDKLEDLQYSLYRSLLNVPFTTPKAALIWEVGGVKMIYRIMMSKLIFMNHILHLEDNSLAKQIQAAQQANNTKGLTQEVQQFIEQLNLPNCFTSRIPQNEWKTLVKKAVMKENENEIRHSSTSYKKMMNKVFDDEKFGCKDYLLNMPISQARIYFQHKYSMMENVKMNFKGNPAYANSLWKCDKCDNQDTSSHLLWCTGYEQERDGLDLESDTDLCKYLHKIITLGCKD